MVRLCRDHAHSSDLGGSAGRATLSCRLQVLQVSAQVAKEVEKSLGGTEASPNLLHREFENLRKALGKSVKAQG